MARSLKNESGSYLVLEDGNLERFEAGKRDPALVAFGRYAFDMSKFSNQGRDVTLGIRERYLWELLSPADDDPVYKQLPGQFRAELHDRFMAPIYPFAFAALTFAFLGSPRTTRQSRNFSIGGSILAVFGLRMAGFACSVHGGEDRRSRLLVQYSMLIAAIGGGLWMIVGGIVVEPPAALIEAINRSNARIAAALWTAGHSMSMMTNTLGRYFAGRFVVSAVGVFASIFVLLVLVDYIEMVRKTSGLASASAITVAETSLFRVPQLLEKMMPFCVLIGAMTCYLALSRRLELRGRARRRRLRLAVHRAGAGQRDRARHRWPPPPTIRCPRTCASSPSGWRRSCSAPRPAAASRTPPASGSTRSTATASAIINAARSEQQGVRLTGLTVFRFDTDLQFKERIEAREATLEDGRWAVQIGAPILPRHAAGRPGQLTISRPRLTAGPGPQQFLHPGDCVFLATTELHPLIGELGLCDRRLPAAVPQAHRAAVFAGCHGDAGGFRERCASSGSAACRRWF